MKVAVWNMCNKADKTTAAEQIQHYFEDGYDAVALQETPYIVDNGRIQPLSTCIASNLGLDHSFIHTRGLSKRHFSGYGMAILSTAGLASARHTTLRTDRWSYASSGRGNQRAAIAFTHPSSPDTRIVVSHLSYRLPLGIGRSGLQDERRNLAMFLHDESRDSHLLFAGDTNCPPRTVLDEQLSMIGLMPIQPVNATADDPTYQSRYPGLGSVKVSLDRVYTSDQVNLRVELGEYGPSDHRPLLITA